MSHAGKDPDLDSAARSEDADEDRVRELEAEVRWLNRILDQMPAAVGISDASGKVVMTNQGVERVWRGNERPEAIEGYSVYRAWWADSGQEVAPAEWSTARALRTREPVYGDLLDIRRFDGSSGSILSSAIPILDDDGTLLGAVGVVQDVTEQRQRMLLSETLNRINKVVHSAAELHDALGEALATGAGALGVSSAGILLRQGDRWRVAHSLNLPGVAVGDTLGDEEIPLAMEAVRSREVVRESAYQDNARLVRGRARDKIRSAIQAPLLTHDRVTGILAFMSQDTQATFSQAQEDFVRHVAATFSLALENARLVEELKAEVETQQNLAVQNAKLYTLERERSRLDRALARIDAFVHSTLECDDVVSQALADAVEAIDCDAGSIVLREGPEWVVRYTAGLDEGVMGARHAAADLAYSSEAADETGVSSFAQRDAHGVVPGYPRNGQVATHLVVPLTLRGDLRGLLFFNRHATQSFDQAQTHFAAQLGSSISIALENGRLYEGERRAARLAAALNTVNELLLSTRSDKEILERIVAEAAETAGADCSLLLERDDREWVVAAVHGLSQEVRGTRFVRGEAPALEETELTRQPVYVADVTTDARQFSQFAQHQGLASYMLFPVVMQSELKAVLEFGYQRMARFDARDVDFARRLSTALSLALENARLYQTERDISETLQQTLLVVPHEIEGVRFSRLYRSATTSARVGGDFIDVFQLGPQRVAFALGDVSGKGLKASTLTAMARDAIRAHAVDGASPAVVAGKANTLLRAFTGPETFVTALFGVLDTASGELSYVNAGHPPGLVVRTDGSISKLEGRNPVLGAFDDVTFSDAQCQLATGDCLVAYSDGITEARGQDGLFGEDRLARIVAALYNQEPEAFVETVYAALTDFTGGELRDDIALIAMTRQP